MEAWKQFVKKMLLGPTTDKNNPVRYLEQHYAELGIYFDPQWSSEKKMLQIAAIHQQLLKTASKADKIEASISDAAPKEQLLYCSEQRMQQLHKIIDAQYDLLLAPFFELIIHQGFIIQPEILPKLLKVVARYPTIHKLCLQVSGARLQWLYHQNPAWDFLIQKSYNTEDFEYGNTTQRIAYFVQLRANKPVEAVLLLQNIWEDEAYEFRLKLMNCLEVNLQLSDEAMLEIALDDGRKKIRQAAAKLLAQLGNSAYVGRMQQLIDSCCLHSSNKIDQLSLAYPKTQLNASMKRDGLELSSKTKLPEADFLLLQIISKVPLQWWRTRLQKNNHELMQWALGQKAAKIIWIGWQIASQNFKDSEWIIDSHQFYVEHLYKRSAWNKMSSYFNYDSVSNACFNHFIRHYFSIKSSKILEDNEILVQLLLQENRTWEQDNALRIIECIQYSIDKNTHVFHWNLKTVLKRASFATPLTCYPKFKQNWPSHSNAWHAWEKEVLNFLDIMAFRMQIKHLKD